MLKICQYFFQQNDFFTRMGILLGGCLKVKNIWFPICGFRKTLRVTELREFYKLGLAGQDS